MGGNKKENKFWLSFCRFSAMVGGRATGKLWIDRGRALFLPKPKGINIVKSFLS